MNDYWKAIAVDYSMVGGILLAKSAAWDAGKKVYLKLSNSTGVAILIEDNATSLGRWQLNKKEVRALIESGAVDGLDF